ncbi:acyl-coenzyme A diphosphatase FITM2-like isoform X1 [Eriocheir sinensis]|uniref:acyl-coenzyme A diphosphatase FITM2-like isoform X1 n=2 Tax=Eriocheir sinensis TaxID=95602 RepID=UPI0021C751FD|nr:acyl-coenzyme A diphosphatase FITM2-like isoform X1 [Eriocheir sinensis]
MNTGQEPYTMRPVLSGITPRRPLRQEMVVLQSAYELDGIEEGKKNYSSSPSIWEQTVSWCRHHLHIPFTFKVAYYITTCLLFSTIRYYVDLPHIEAITGRQSILNQVFVKKAWGITLVVFSLYRITSLFLRPKLRVDLKQFLVRSAVTTLCFFFWCQAIFPVIDDFSSTCIAGNQTLALSKYECLSKEGREYLSFDISGHAFLLTFCVLVMMDESKEILYFLWLGKWLFGEATQDKTEDSTWPTLEEKAAKSLRKWFPLLSPLVAITFLIMCALALLWDFMILITTLYYHSFAEKGVGTALALLSWGLIYRAAFPRLFKLRVLGT